VDLEERGVSPMLRSSSAPDFQPVGEPKQAAEPTPRAFPRIPLSAGRRLIPRGKGRFDILPADQPTIEEGFARTPGGETPEPLSFA
jgi:hypothetical protein